MAAPSDRRLVSRLNTSWHRPALITFGIVVAAHWAEHVVQAVQIWVFGVARPQARGVLGQAFPWLVSSEALHLAYAVVMVAGLGLLLPGMVGHARRWWAVAFGIQIWHLVEHSLLGIQAWTTPFWNEPVPTSVVQLVVPRVELHLIYNAAVTVPMVLAMAAHRWPNRGDRGRAHCDCAVPLRRRNELAAA